MSENIFLIFNCRCRFFIVCCNEYNLRRAFSMAHLSGWLWLWWLCCGLSAAAGDSAPYRTNMCCVSFCEEPIEGTFSRYPDWTDAEQTNWRGQRISSTWPSCLPSLPRWLTGSFIALHRQNVVRVLHCSDYSRLVIAMIWLLCLFNEGEKVEDENAV